MPEPQGLSSYGVSPTYAAAASASAPDLPAMAAANGVAGGPGNGRGEGGGEVLPTFGGGSRGGGGVGDTGPLLGAQAVGNGVQMGRGFGSAAYMQRGGWWLPKYC